MQMPEVANFTHTAARTKHRPVGEQEAWAPASAPNRLWVGAGDGASLSEAHIAKSISDMQ